LNSQHNVTITEAQLRKAGGDPLGGAAPAHSGSGGAHEADDADADVGRMAPAPAIPSKSGTDSEEAASTTGEVAAAGNEWEEADREDRQQNAESENSEMGSAGDAQKTGPRRRNFPHDEGTLLELFRRLSGPPESLRDGDRAALRDRLVLAHTPLVDHCARSFVATGEPIEDLVQEGYIGLIKAVDRFDPDKGVRFSTYACHLIAGEMRHYLRDLGKLIHEPGWHGQLRARVVRQGDALAQKLGRVAEVDEIARALDMQPQIVRAVLDTHNVLAVESLDAPTGDADEGGRPGHEERAAPDVEPHTTHVENHLMLDAAMPRLRELEQRAIKLFYYQERSKTEIARELKISVNYASYLVKRGLESLRRAIEEHETVTEKLAATPTSRVLTPQGLAAWLASETVKMPRYALVIFQIENWASATARLSSAQRGAAEKLAEEITRKCCRLADRVLPLASPGGEALTFVGLLAGTDQRGRRVGERWADSCTSRAVCPHNLVGVDALLCDYLYAFCPHDGNTPAAIVEAVLAQL
jgi:RNA polymerase sigma-B factor